MITLHQVEQGSDEWLELRSKLYTGSNADKLLAHASKTKVIDGISSGYALAEITGFTGNFYTRRGHLLEDEAIELYQEITEGVGVRVDGKRVGFVTNSRYPGCGYSPDDIYPSRTIECKAFEESKHLAMLKGDIPLKVLAQCHFGMLICEKKICDLLVYNPNLDADQALGIITIKFNRNIANNFKRVLALAAQPALG